MNQSESPTQHEGAAEPSFAEQALIEAEGVQFLAGTELAANMGFAFEWFEAMTDIQREMAADFVADFQATAVKAGRLSPLELLADHWGRRIEHLSRASLRMLDLTDEELQRAAALHGSVWRSLPPRR